LISRILIVGSGSIGMRHLRIARNLMPYASIKFLRHEPLTPSQQLSDGCFTDLKDALAFNPEIAIIANPAPFHLEITKALCGIGAHVLVEKPIATTTEGVLELMDLVKSKKVVVMVGYNLRFSPSLMKFREFLSKEIIGKVLSVRCETGQYLPTWRPNSNYKETVSAKSRLGGGVLLELSHEIDYLIWIFGEIDWVRATLSKQSDLEVDVEDTAHLVIGFASDFAGKQVIGAVNLDFIRHDSKRECTALGENGSLRWDGLSGTVELLRAGTSGPEILFKQESNQDETYIAEWRDFLACIRSGESTRVTIQDALDVLVVIEAIRKSAKAGNQVSVRNTPNEVVVTK
jgi:predicted dehydrogenase